MEQKTPPQARRRPPPRRRGRNTAAPREPETGAPTGAGAGLGRRVGWSALGALALGAGFVAAFERGVLVPVAAPLGAAMGATLAAVACGLAAELRHARAARRRAEALAATDPLTGLPNVRAFRAALEREVAAALRTGTPCTLVAFDLDRFKAINDTLGHAAGDRVLAAAAAACRDVARRADVPARLGGEEFALLLSGADADDALAVAERLRTAFRAIAVPGLDRPVTASFGIATCPEDAVEAGALLAAADAAAYAAKHAGRDRVHVAMA
jgi:diguanylate cyclase (GGDEF)-like protein